MRSNLVWVRFDSFPVKSGSPLSRFMCVCVGMNRWATGKSRTKTTNLSRLQRSDYFEKTAKKLNEMQMLAIKALVCRDPLKRYSETLKTFSQLHIVVVGALSLLYTCIRKYIFFLLRLSRNTTKYSTFLRTQKAIVIKEQRKFANFATSNERQEKLSRFKFLTLTIM